MLHRDRVRVFLTLGILLFALCTFAQDATRILRVQERRPGPAEAIEAPTSNVLQLDKFREERLDTSGHLFYVHWQPARGGIPAGSVVRFEYRQEDSTRIQVLDVKYPFQVTAPRRATFKISGEALRQGGLVTAWRVQILQGTKVLAVKQSADWR